MTTSLAAQLAKIAANSSNPLDLKAQKKAHSKSLLFEPDVATTQDFDTLFDICAEGFQELCKLDSRFLVYTRSIFGEQSKREDRAQMNEAQNEELNGVLDSFLSLVGARLLLKPAIKSVEWLVRRFRIHEHNTASLILTFLPYHALPMFKTVLSILPKRLIPTFKFLQPYIESVVCPPRHAIVHSATHNPSFFGAFNGFVLNCSRAGHQYAALISFWAIVATEAIAGQVDQTSVGPRLAQRHKEEDILLRILPFLNEGLPLRTAPDLRVGCYMILTVLASKLSLQDRVLDAMMEGVASGSTHHTSHAELICYAVLTQRKDDTQLPEKVFKAMMSINSLEDNISTIGKQYQVEHLVHGIILGLLRRLKKNGDGDKFSFIRTAIETPLMDEAHVKTAVRAIISTVNDLSSSECIGYHLQGQLANLVLQLAASPVVGEVVRAALTESDLDIEHLEMRLQAIVQPSDVTTVPMDTDVSMDSRPEEHVPASLDSIIATIPALAAEKTSFLSPNESDTFELLSQAFIRAAPSPKDRDKFLQLPIFNSSSILLPTFLIRIWCGVHVTGVRSTAIVLANGYVKRISANVDLQLLLPYLLYALADPSLAIRRAAADLILTISERDVKSGDTPEKHRSRVILGKDHVYGQREESQQISWLSNEETAAFIEHILLPNLEESRLDASYGASLLRDALSGTRHSAASKTGLRDLKTSYRAAILDCVCSHIIRTPLYAVRLRLLEMLRGIEKVGSRSRTKALFPLLVGCRNDTFSALVEQCKAQQIDHVEYVEELASIVSSNDRESLRILQRIIANKDAIPSPALLREKAIGRLTKIWPKIKSDMQLSLATTLLNLAINPSAIENPELEEIALDSLRGLALSPPILLSFLENMPKLAASLGELSSSSKRRRTSTGHVDEDSSTGRTITETKQNLQYITLVLELVQASDDGISTDLLAALGQVLVDLQQCRLSLGNQVNYTQSLVLDCMNVAIEKLKKTPGTGTSFTASVIPSDTIVNSFRTSSNPQIQQAALLLISNLASIFPEVIVHHIMPVFTNFGETILKYSDEYSTHITDLAIRSVIPPLVASLRKQKSGPIAGVSELLLGFVAAFEHIPEYRRLPLFSALVNKVGPDEFLHVLLILLLNRHSKNKKIEQFALELTGQFSPLTQLKSLRKYLAEVLDMFQPKRPTPSQLTADDNDRAGVNRATRLLTVASRILRSSILVSRMEKILDKNDALASELQEIYASMIEQTLQLIQAIPPSKKLPATCDELLHALLSLMSIQNSITALNLLLEQAPDNVRRRVLQSLETRITSIRTGDTAAQDACLGFLPQLMSILAHAPDSLLAQTAISCADRIIERFGKRHPSHAISVARAVSGENGLGAADRKLQVIALLHLATSAQVLEEAIVPIIPQTLPRALDLLKTSIRETKIDSALHNAAYSFFEGLLDYVPWIVSGEYLDQLLKISHVSAATELEPECDRARVEVMDLIAKKVGAQECFGTLDNTWESAINQGPEAVAEHLQIIQRALERHSKRTVVKHSKDLLAIFLKVLDTRRLQLSGQFEGNFDEEELKEIEQTTNEIMIKMIYKLNDTHFRPLFISMLDWSKTATLKDDKKGRIFRQTTFYAFLLTFFETLKSIVTSYASFIVDSTAEILKTNGPSELGSKTLWSRVIATLHSAFDHDQDEFWQAPARFDTISAPLLAQISHAQSLSSEDTESLIRCITALAAVADSQDHQKAINVAVLQHMRSDAASVRLAAVQCQMGLTERLREDWLTQLPEMLPFISEAMEDDDERVEGGVRTWVRKIEEILGESLDGMLQ